VAYPAEFAQMKNDKEGDFFIAISCFNTTHMLIAYLYMNKMDIQDHLKKLRAGRKQFKKFAYLNS